MIPYHLTPGIIQWGDRYFSIQTDTVESQLYVSYTEQVYYLDVPSQLQIQG